MILIACSLGILHLLYRFSLLDQFQQYFAAPRFLFLLFAHMVIACFEFL